MSTRLTTHVLDLTGGRPAAGVEVVLTRLDGDAPGEVRRVRTNADGRTDQPLLEGDELTPGRYELAYGVGAYFASTTDGPPPAVPYLDVVPVRVGVAPGTAHLHVALLVTPWSYTTYRGS